LAPYAGAEGIRQMGNAAHNSNCRYHCENLPKPARFGLIGHGGGSFGRSTMDHEQAANRKHEALHTKSLEKAPAKEIKPATSSPASSASINNENLTELVTSFDDRREAANRINEPSFVLTSIHPALHLEGQERNTAGPSTPSHKPTVPAAGCPAKPSSSDSPKPTGFGFSLDRFPSEVLVSQPAVQSKKLITTMDETEPVPNPPIKATGLSSSSNRLSEVANMDELDGKVSSHSIVHFSVTASSTPSIPGVSFESSMRLHQT
jgi:hypothetical protein